MSAKPLPGTRYFDLSAVRTDAITPKVWEIVTFVPLMVFILWVKGIQSKVLEHNVGPAIWNARHRLLPRSQRQHNFVAPIYKTILQAANKDRPSAMPQSQHA